MKTIKIKPYLTATLLQLFPVGIWLGLQGYDIAAGICLIAGFAPIAALVVGELS